MKSMFALLGLLLPSLASAQLEWRISIKLFTGSGGALPQNPNWGIGPSLYQSITNDIAWVNGILDGTGRGYRWRLTEIVTVPGTTAPTPATTNSWYNLPVGGGTQDDLDGKVKSNPVGFAFRNNAINFYYVNAVNGPNGGYCSFPTEGQDTILVAPNSFQDVLLHESGHFFGLQHTFNSGGSCNGSAPVTLGDDGIADTAQDYPCGTLDQLSQGLYGQPYANLNAGQQAWVNTAWLNIMSYHQNNNGGFGTILTSDQLDVMTDNSNDARNNVASGHTRFVDQTGFPLFQFGTSTFPYVSVGNGVNGANNGDIVLLRPGNYNEPGTYTKPATFRATRGNATIGTP